jgi:hypothetical protein
MNERNTPLVISDPFYETDFGPTAPENPTTPGIKHDIIINRYLSHGRRHWRTAANAVRNQAQRK